MRAKDVAPRLCSLGAQVFYTHRASGVLGGTLRDVGSRDTHRVRKLLGGYVTTLGRWGSIEQPHMLRAPHARRRPHVDGAVPLHRWVVAWPEAGYGTVVGITTRSSGWTDPGGGYGYSSYGLEPPDPDPPHFDEHERYPVYEVKTTLRGRAHLVPVWACVPLPRQDYIVRRYLDDSQPPLLLDDAGVVQGGWETWVAAWLQPGVRVAA